MKNGKKLFVWIVGISLSACGQMKKGQETQVHAAVEKQTIDTSFLDLRVAPKEDFFRYANGNWIKNNPVPASESRWGSFNELDKNNKSKLSAILMECRMHPNSADQKLLGNYYVSFTNMDKRNELGIFPIKEDLDKIRGVRSKSELTALIASLQLNGVSCLFRFGVEQDMRKVERHITVISQGGIGLPNRDYYFGDNKKEVREKYQVYMQQVLILLGYTEKDALQMANTVMQMETDLASQMMTPAELRLPEKTYNKRSMEEVASSFGSFDFELFLSGIGSKSFDSLIVSQPSYMQHVGKLLDEKELSTWKNYLEWCLVNEFAKSLSDPFVQLHFDFYGKTLSGKAKQKPLGERAIDEITQKGFGELLGKAFVEKHFSKSSQQKVNEMVDNLLVVFQERIHQLDWMSEVTKKEALTKLNSIGRKLGFPDKWEDFSGLTFDSLSYVQNLKLESQYAYRKNMEELTRPVDRSKWEMPAHMVNAYYHPLLNEIAFPAGIMQPPFFDEGTEDAVNYGRIGAVIGHEFTHGFDDMGSKFAADGTFRNWWTEEDRKAFEVKTGLLGETFAVFCPFEDNCVNPQLTMGENIADLGGLTLAFHAYKRTDECKAGTIRYGFTPEQRFFIAYAQLWKVNYTDAELKKRIATDPHSPGMYRVNGPLKNCPEFFDAFSIQEGDWMRNPAGKLSKIW